MRNGFRTLCGFAAALELTFAVRAAEAATYEVGPGRTHANITDVPLDSLGPGDTVLIYWQAAPYRERFGIDTAGTASAPIVIRGVPNGRRELPVIDGDASFGGYNSHTRGLIHIDGGAAYVVIENLELRGANAAAGLQDNSAGIFAPGGSHLTFRNLHIHHSGNGLFTWVDSSDVLVEGCYIHDNGNADSLYEHNIYTESNGITFQLNLITPLLSGARGNNLKDRSAGTVIRYNWVEGGNRALDLVESQDGAWDHQGDPTFVYGNVLIKHEDTGQSQVVHFGGDDGSRPDRTLLYFFHNTVYSDRSDRTTLFYVNASATADVRNNIFHGPVGGLELLDPDDSSAAIVELGVNWLSSGWTLGSSSATINGAAGQLAGTDPSLSNIPTDFSLLSGSPARDAGAALAAGAAAHPVALDYAERGVAVHRRDLGAADLGALAFDSAPPDNGEYQLQNVLTGKCAQVAGASTANGANIEQATCTGAEHQSWRLIRKANGSYRIRALHSNKCMRAHSSADGDNVQQGACRYKRSKWHVVALAAGGYQLKSYLVGTCVEVAGGSSADGTNLQQRSCGLGDAQRFALVPVAAEQQLVKSWPLQPADTKPTVAGGGVGLEPAAADDKAVADRAGHCAAVSAAGSTGASPPVWLALLALGWLVTRRAARQSATSPPCAR